jgi:hypothetical protein
MVSTTLPTRPPHSITLWHPALEFSFAYRIKVRDHSPNRQSKTNLDLKIKSKVVKLNDISKLILIILELLVSLMKLENESCKLRSKLRDYLVNYGWINQRPNLLLEVCTSYEGKTSQFKLIKLLLERIPTLSIHTIATLFIFWLTKNFQGLLFGVNLIILLRQNSSLHSFELSWMEDSMKIKSISVVNQHRSVFILLNSFWCIQMPNYASWSATSWQVFVHYLV